MKDKTATPILDVVRSQMQADDATDYRAMLDYVKARRMADPKRLPNPVRNAVLAFRGVKPCSRGNDWCAADCCRV